MSDTIVISDFLRLFIPKTYVQAKIVPSVAANPRIQLPRPGGRLMATGWAGDGAVQDQIDATVKDGIKRARSKLPSGPGLERCEECDSPIPEARRKAMPGVRLCVPCQEALDHEAGSSGYNRRGSKDSQLR
jgi:phage/conjugal plasmid C-4 type zinc finger TraR family protein